MKQANIDNLVSLWLTAAQAFSGYNRSGNLHIISIANSEWPNRIWCNPDDAIHAEEVQKLMQEHNGKLTFSHWIPVDRDEYLESEKLGLQLKSLQIGMSLSLSDYQEEQIAPTVSLNPVNTLEEAQRWSEVFKNCFNYLIPEKVISAIRDKANFYLITKNADTVGCVATYIKDGQIGIHCLGTLGTYRKQGIGENVMHQVLADAKNKNITTAHLQSSMMGLGIYTKLGFKQLFKMCNCK